MEIPSDRKIGKSIYSEMKGRAQVLKRDESDIYKSNTGSYLYESKLRYVEGQYRRGVKNLKRLKGERERRIDGGRNDFVERD